MANAAVSPCGSIVTNTSGIGPQPNQYTVDLTGVCNAQYVTVTLTGVIVGSNGPFDSSITMGVLIGDLNGDGAVNIGDRIIVRNHSGENLDSSNFKCDVTDDGLINVGDTVVVKNNSGTGLP